MSYVKDLLSDISCWMGLQGEINSLVILVAKVLEQYIEEGLADSYESAFTIYLSLGGNYVDTTKRSGE